MSDLVKDLPAEYRTPSLESLPEDLQVLAVSAIREQFGLKKNPNRITNILSKVRAILDDDPMFVYPDDPMFVDPSALFIDPSKSFRNYDFQAFS